MDLINTQGSVLVLDLASTFGISEVTIRADLRLLEKKGLATRFHGGAARPGSHLTEPDNQEVVLEDRYQLASDPKKRIAQAAVAMIQEGMTITVEGFRSKDGSNNANGARVTFPDGRSVFTAGAEDRAPGDGKGK